MKASRHYLALFGTLLLGAGLRFWNLDTKPAWLDEVITALFSLGHGYNDVPLNQAFPVSALEHVFTFQPDKSCAQLAETVSTQSIHPPLFFCWMHYWLSWLQPVPQSWIWKLRAFPAVMGIGAIAGIYQLNRVAFSPTAGLWGAAIMAVSPFAVYLSQEARHYTLPMLLVILALGGLYQIHLDLYRQQFRPPIWLGWMAINSLGFYIHYFFLLALSAQVGVLLLAGISGWRDRETGAMGIRSVFTPRQWIAIALAVSGICFTYLPWVSTFLQHIRRPETDWMLPFQPSWQDAIAPLIHLPINLILMLIALPVEEQPWWIAGLSGLAMLIVVAWVVWQVAGALRQCWMSPASHLVTRLLVVFVLTVLLELLAIAYISGKDLISVPRYHFIYFPAVCALLGASLEKTVTRPMQKRTTRRLPIGWVVLLVGLISSGCVVSNLVFQKPFHPESVARTMGQDPAQPFLVSMTYANLQDVALGVSFGLELQRQNARASQPTTVPYFELLSRSPTYNQVWQQLSRLKQPFSGTFNLWVIAPGLRGSDYPSQLALTDHAGQSTACIRDPEQYYRIGIPYQRYRCL
jgi:uncharacterized membrane protein